MIDALVLALLPLTSDSYVPFATEARISAKSETRIEVACGDQTRSMTIAANSTVLERCASDSLHVMGDVTVEAIHRTPSAIESIPVLDAEKAIIEGAVTAHRDDPDWTSEIGIVNPGNSTAFVTFGHERTEVASHALRVVKTTSTTFAASEPVLVFRVDANTHSGARVITLATTIPHHRRAVQFPSAAAPTPHTITLTPSKDNTLFETTDGSISDGIGPHLFSGTTASFSRRRALVAFDLASQIPAGSTVTSVSFTMQVSKTIAADQTVELHAVSQDWGEGASNAGAGRDGGGAIAKNGDATWLHTFFPDKRWTRAGGDFASAVDAAVSVFGAGDNVTWPSSAAMIARVQAWVDQAATNFGWIVIGEEASPGTTKEFASREQVPATVRPALTIDYTTH